MVANRAPSYLLCVFNVSGETTDEQGNTRQVASLISISVVVSRLRLAQAIGVLDRDHADCPFAVYQWDGPSACRVIKHGRLADPKTGMPIIMGLQSVGMFLDAIANMAPDMIGTAIPGISPIIQTK